ncbi:MAG TPA: bifunctional oligoribonuclease/PAP phosphatase NrnA [Synergistaceae bacterium]|nr:bifunctional oligoribonuclease/PAP phosphatase NrnA [Synergistaceae bacterium]HPJ25238.1 bifunctional oligoribonuclease/PAP phosphatase NrnA [Synergistaceae bacterium]HPQ36109.1 bifunctional oligoribonuclease/PAP phosphatase NrnA [Synergistaceae bacterium]
MSRDIAMALKILQEASTWIILSHVRPDGDTLGSASALIAMGKNLGKNCFWLGPDSIPENLLFLPYAEEYRNTLKALPRDLPGHVCLVALDISHESRCLQEALDLRKDREYPLVVLDHHGDNSLFGDYHVIDSRASATAEIIHTLALQASWPLDKTAALGLYTGIVTDCGNFRYANTTPETHRITAHLLELGVSPPEVEDSLNGHLSLGQMCIRGRALSRVQLCLDGKVAWSYVLQEDFSATGTGKDHLEGLASQLLRLEGVDFSIFLYQDTPLLQGSLRSKGRINAQKIAQTQGGGGHPQASGFSTVYSLEETLQSLKEELRRAYGEAGYPSLT